MTVRKLIFRADGSQQTGLGHLYRVFAMIEMLKNECEYVLVTRFGAPIEVIPDTYYVHIIPANVSISDEPDYLAKNFPPFDYMLVADGYQFTSAYQKEVKRLNYKMIYIDDLVKEHMFADIVVNHSLGVKQRDYQSEAYTLFALGTSYAILRPAFLEATKCTRNIGKISTAFVCFGGADPPNLTLTAVKALLAFSVITRINIVLGAAYSNREIFLLAEKHKHICIHQNLTDQGLVHLMKECDFAIAPASTILYEIFAVKMPVLSGYYIENQKKIYQGCVENGLVFEGGDLLYYEEADFKFKIEQILAENKYTKFLSAQSALFDSKIKNRFIRLIQPITYREASEIDLPLTYRWANDKLSRANSYFSEPIEMETHEAWFKKKLRDKHSIIYIASMENMPAGMIRYDLYDDHAVVGVMVDENFRGRGLAAEFLRTSASIYFRNHNLPVIAFIKEKNVASIKTFEAAGYKLTSHTLVHNEPSVIYRLELAGKNE